VNGGYIINDTATGWKIGVRGLDSRRGLGIFLFLTQPPIQLVAGAPSSWIKRPGREFYHSPHPSAKVRMRGHIPPPPQ
jgi:hypothetical protein